MESDDASKDARSPKNSEEEKKRAVIRQYIVQCPQYRQTPSTLALLSKCSVEEVKAELEAYALEIGKTNILTTLAARMKTS